MKPQDKILKAIEQYNKTAKEKDKISIGDLKEFISGYIVKYLKENKR